jgi:hypothetical protein
MKDNNKIIGTIALSELKGIGPAFLNSSNKRNGRLKKPGSPDLGHGPNQGCLEASENFILLGRQTQMKHEPPARAAP